MFFVFAGEQYYPSGGMGDYVGVFVTLKETKAAATRVYHDWWEIAELRDGDLVIVEND